MEQAAYCGELRHFILPTCMQKNIEENSDCIKIVYGYVLDDVATAIGDNGISGFMA
jgi:hypothetical protein